MASSISDEGAADIPLRLLFCTQKVKSPQMDSDQPVQAADIQKWKCSISKWFAVCVTQRPTSSLSLAGAFWHPLVPEVAVSAVLTQLYESAVSFKSSAPTSASDSLSSSSESAPAPSSSSWCAAQHTSSVAQSLNSRRALRWKPSLPLHRSRSAQPAPVFYASGGAGTDAGHDQQWLEPFLLNNRFSWSTKPVILYQCHGAHLLFGFAPLCPASRLLLLTQTLLFIEGILTVQQQ